MRRREFAERAMEAFAEKIEAQRFAFHNESGLQEQLGRLFEIVAKGTVQREFRLSASERPDFWHANSGVAIEVKVAFSGGSPSSVVRQLMRYAALDAVAGVLFVTSSHRLGAAVPVLLRGKPVRRVVLTTFA